MRDLYKVYGLRFVIKTTGRAGKFSMVPLLLSLGSGLGLLAIVSINTEYFMSRLFWNCVYVCVCQGSEFTFFPTSKPLLIEKLLTSKLDTLTNK